MFRILCSVSGGVTGSRCAVLKDSDGQPKHFATFDEASNEAQRLNREMNTIYSVASFSYKVIEN